MRRVPSRIVLRNIADCDSEGRVSPHSAPPDEADMSERMSELADAFAAPPSPVRGSHSSFDERRKMHYNMRQVLRAGSMANDADES